MHVKEFDFNNVCSFTKYISEIRVTHAKTSVFIILNVRIKGICGYFHKSFGLFLSREPC